MFSRNILTRCKDLNKLKKILALQQKTLSVAIGERSKIVLTDYQTDDDDIERVFKIPTINGFDILRNPKLNKGTAFSLTERQILGIHGLLPPAVNNEKVQMKRVMLQIRSLKNDLQKYIMLNQVLARNERLYYQILMRYTEELLPIVYTPTVGKACQEFGLIFRDPKGLFITIHDLGHVYDIITNWPERRVQAVVMTDGERILGLGDLGANGMGIPIGKLALYTACAGIHPSACLPLMIDVGTNNEKLLDDPMYIGLREKRHDGPEYDQLIDEIIQALRKRYGASVLIQFEDFAGHNSARLLDKTRNNICSFNDDIQGTASVVVGGLMGCQRILDTKLTEHRFLFFGAGAAGCGIGHLIVQELRKNYGLSKREAAKNIYMFDKLGLLTRNRAFGDIERGQELFCHDIDEMDNFHEVVKKVKPTAIIGVSGVGKAFTKEAIEEMHKHTSKPIIFALSNPTSHAECTAEEAYTWTNGQCLFASGSPFAPVTLADGRTIVPGQGNNVYIFPGVALGVIATGARIVPDEMFLVAAKTLAQQLTEEDMQEGRVYPQLGKIKDVSFKIAVEVAKLAYKMGITTVLEPESIEELVDSIRYNPHYISNIPMTFSYPDYHAELH